MINEFYLISTDEDLPNEDMKLRNLGTRTISMIIGGRRGESNTFYRDTTSEDYDRHFVSKIMRYNPVYEVEKFLDFHLEFYSKDSTEKKTQFLKHIKYVVFPILKKDKNSESQQDLVNEWLENNMNKKNKHEKININIGDINSPSQFQINTENSVQKQKFDYSNENILELFKLITSDLNSIKSSDAEELKAEINKAESKLNQGKDIKSRLLVVGELMKDIGIGTFTTLLASPIYETIKPLIGM